jgi:hypothetical protein
VNGVLRFEPVSRNASQQQIMFLKRPTSMVTKGIQDLALLVREHRENASAPCSTVARLGLCNRMERYCTIPARQSASQRRGQSGFYADAIEKRPLYSRVSPKTILSSTGVQGSQTVGFRSVGR